jgi:hypothetical protein
LLVLVKHLVQILEHVTRLTHRADAQTDGQTRT